MARFAAISVDVLIGVGTDIGNGCAGTIGGVDITPAYCYRLPITICIYRWWCCGIGFGIDIGVIVHKWSREVQCNDIKS